MNDFYNFLNFFSDLLLTAVCVLAFLIQIYHIKERLVTQPNIAFINILRLSGWGLFSCRYIYVMLTTQDIIISWPSFLAIMAFAVSDLIKKDVSWKIN